jgi:hypothetical protein
MLRLLLITLVLLVVGCQRSATPPAPSQPPTLTPARPTAAAPAATAEPVPRLEPTVPRTVAPTVAACGYGAANPIAQLEERSVKEGSGLASSRRQAGVYWTLNDSGNTPDLFAFDQQGRRLGTFRVEGARNEDWESLQAGPGPNGQPSLYIGDTGDNRGTRPEAVIYRVPEPEATTGQSGRAASGRTAPAEALRYVFPDRPRDVEALLVHPRSAEILLVTKDLSGRAVVYRLPPAAQPGQRSILEPVAELDLRPLGVFSFLVTDGSVAPDGGRVVLRTYLAALEYQVPPAADLSAIWGQQPAIYPLEDSRQGEAVTYRTDGQALLSLGESSPAQLFQAEWRC